jgi:hypothetical protein
MPWSDWQVEVTSFEVEGAPAVSSWQEGRLDVFVRGTDNNLYHRVYENDAWQGADWEEMSDGNEIETSPGAVSWGHNRIDLFAVWDQQVHHRAFQNGVWSAWGENLEGVTADGLAAASWKIERVDVLVRASDDFMSRRFWESGAVYGWMNWENVAGVATHLLSAPAAVATGLNRIDCFGRGDSDHLIHGWYQGAFQQPWEVIDTTLAIKDAPAAVSGVTAGQGRVDVFVRGPDDHMKHRIYFSALQPYQPGGPIIYTVVPNDTLSKIAQWNGMTLTQLLALNPQITNPNLIHPGEQIVVGFNQAVPGHGDWQTGGSWEDIGTGLLASSPAAVGCWNSGFLKRIDCFAQDADHKLIHTWWT